MKKFRDPKVPAYIQKESEMLRESANFQLELAKKAAKSGSYSSAMNISLESLYTLGESAKIVCDSLIEQNNYLID